MGLDSVELLMAVEVEFALKITDGDAEKMLRVGDMHAAILSKLRARGENPDEAEIWRRLRELVVEQLGVRPEEVTPTARFIDDLGVD